ncbi:MAG TPA: S9 family peptidase [Bryobacteraceae bacterium]|nr:S9 family peptidase [Bryobacteraceae bacterium]
MSDRKKWPLLFLTIGIAFGQWTPELSMKVKTVTAAVPSPDGKIAVWTETHPVMDGDKSETNTQIYLAGVDGSNRVELTRGEKSSNAPAFSPDSHWVFFASDRSGKRNIYRIPVDGGEAEMVTNWTGTLAAFSVSPNGKWIAFTGREPDHAEEIARREKMDFRVIDENPHNNSLWIIPVEPNVEGKREVKKIAAGPYNVGQFDWSPDSTRIAYETRPTPDADDGRKSDLLEVAIESGAIRNIAATRATESEPHYSPDGRYLAYVRSGMGAKRIDGSRIVLLTLADLKSRELPATPDESPRLDSWARDSSKIFFSEGWHTREALYAMPVDGPPSIVFQTSRGTFSPQVVFNAAGSYAGMAMQSPDEPVEAYVMPVASLKPVRVSAANTSLPKEPIGETRVIRWKAKDGKEIEGLLTLPAGYDQSKKYPLILNIHGGPSGAFLETFIGASGLYPIASFAAHGWAVLRANPRGSTNYGLPFRVANVDDWGGGDYQDLMSGVDSVIQMGVADPNRLAVMGWSYGGYMTDWVITQTHRFKCASSGAGISDLISMWGTNDIPSTLDDYFEGTWYEQPERYIKMSPLAHVANVTTPTLFLHGAIDPRVPTTQGYEMYHGLKSKGVPAEMVIYPRTQHGPQEPKFILDIMHRNIDWVAKYIGE